MGSQLKHILVLSLSLVTLVNCGGSSNKGKALAVGFVSTQELEEAVLSTEQRNIATRICTSYRNKTTKFRMPEFIGDSFQFKSTNTDCSNKKKEFTVDTTLRWNDNNNLEFFTADVSKPVFSIVQTDTTGFLSQLCNKIFTGEEIANTTIVAGRKIQIEFFRKDLDSYTIRTFNFTNNETAAQFDSADTFQVRTQFNVSGEQIVGMDEIITTQKVCPKPSTPSTSTANLPESSIFTQTFVKRTQVP